MQGTFDAEFPAPLEADRYIYGFGWVFDCSGIEIEFPAPPEVDRVLYTKNGGASLHRNSVSVPSRGR